VDLACDMAIRIDERKQPRRPHFIEEWAKYRGFDSQAELADALGVDKSMISRWYGGATPNEESQKKLATLFECERDALFRHPSEDWFVRFFRNRSDEEVGRMKKVLESGWPPKPENSR
jgi:hypothetical protein